MDQKDTNNQDTTSNGQSGTELSLHAFYNKHGFVSVIVKKTEKVATAIYMVTDFIREDEPLRKELRTLSLGLVSRARKIHARSHDNHYALTDDVARATEEIKGLLELGMTIGMISEMNGKILFSELGKIVEDLRKVYGEKKTLVRMHPGYANVLLSEDMFRVEGEKAIDRALLEDKGHILNGQQKVENVRKEEPKDTPIKSMSVSKNKDIGSKIARRNDVLNIIKSKGQVSVKDIVSILKDTGEKTIQRELLSLVKEGVLVKEGEKRWTMYRMNSK